MGDFLNHICGQNLLQIVATGNSIIAELLRLKDYVPEAYKLSTKEDMKKYGEVIVGFAVFEISESFEKNIERDRKLYDIDAELRLANIEILTRFYLAFDSIHQYVTSINQFVKEVNCGFYIQQTILTILNDAEGRQLLCESLNLYGVILLIVDLHIPGEIRERLIVAYTRYSAQKSHGDSNIDEVCKLLRSTGFKNFCKRPSNYPHEYFQRVQLDQTFIQNIIEILLRSDDIYNQFAVFPFPEHRSTALATQASMLFICLFFSPQTLQNQSSRMREIVDKFFPDNWIVSVYMGITVSLVDAWEPYKSAKVALAHTIDSSHVKEICEAKKISIQKLLNESREILKAGVLNEKSVMNDISKSLRLMRNISSELRWAMLHSNSTVFQNDTKKDLKDLVIQELKHPPVVLFELMVNASQFEFIVKDVVKNLLGNREKRYTEYKIECESRLQDLSDAFSGDQLLIKIPKNESLAKWFIDMKHEVEKLKFDEAQKTSQTLIRMIRAIDEVQVFHNIDSNMHVKQCLREVSDFIHKMTHMLNVKDELLITIQLINDFSYAWCIVDNWTTIMQDSIKRQPNLVIKLRALFLKLSSALDIPLLRINQAKSDDLISVSQYYSHQLIDYVRNVIQIIPKTIFEILGQIIKLQSEDVCVLPAKVEKGRLKDFAQLDQRYNIAKLTYSISVFTEGVLAMQKTLVGVIEIDPKELLEDGIRIELINNISKSFEKHFIFGRKIYNLDEQLNELENIINGYKRSFEYIQDYMNIKGLQIWQTEISRLVNFAVERECNKFSKHKVQAWQSKYQSNSVPVSVNDNETFIGALANEILRITSPKTSNFLSTTSAWYDLKSNKEVINISFSKKLMKSIGVSGIHGLDHIFACMINEELICISKLLKSDVSLLEQVISDISMNQKAVASFSAKQKKNMKKVLEMFAKVGQKQIFRHHFAYNLYLNLTFNSKSYENALKNFNDALLLELDNDNTISLELLIKLNYYLLQTGACDPCAKVYSKQILFPNLATLLSYFILSHVTKLSFTHNDGEFIAKRNDTLDGYLIVVGLVTYLRQFKNDVTHVFIKDISLYLVSICRIGLCNKEQLNQEALAIFKFLEIFDELSGMPRKIHIPETLINQYSYISKKKK